MRIRIEIVGPPGMRAPRWLGRVSAFTLILCLVGGVSLWASHQFTDVPDSHLFHDAIGRLVGAGITAGTGPGTFTPEGFVTRGEFAAFMGRAAGRVAQSTTLLNPTFNLSQGIVPVAEVAITVPGVGAATQFVSVYGEVTVFGGCDCIFAAWLQDVTGGTQSSASLHEFTTTSHFARHNTQRAWVFAVPPGARTFRLGMQIASESSVPATDLGLFNPSLVAMTFPFGAAGGNTPGVVTEGAASSAFGVDATTAR